MRRIGRFGWRWVAAAVLVSALAVGLGLVLRAAGLAAAANAAQLIALTPLIVALIGWARKRHGKDHPPAEQGSLEVKVGRHEDLAPISSPESSRTGNPVAVGATSLPEAAQTFDSLPDKPIFAGGADTERKAKYSAEGTARAEFRRLRTAQRHTTRGGRRSIAAKNASARLVRCPICLCQIDWKEAQKTPVIWSEDQVCYLPVSRQRGETERHWRQRAANAAIRCPSDDKYGYPHYLPSLYGAYGEPIIIPAVGQTNSGKTTLLTMLGAQLEQGTALSGELSFRSLDQGIGNRFQQEFVRPLLEERRQLYATTVPSRGFFFQAWRGYNHRTGRPFVLAFFDCAGEELARADSLPRFLSAASAFLFLADAAAIMGRPENFASDYHGDAATHYVLDMMHERHLDTLPAATVIAKSDLLRQRPEVWQWLGKDDDTDLSTVEQESEDAYTFLSLNTDSGWLRPARELPLSTLHFLSATGTSVDPNTLLFDQRHFGSRRVLRPLLTLFRAIGLIDTSQFTTLGGAS